MSIDEVFGGGEAPAPPPEVGLARVRRLLLVSLVLDVLGPCCFTGVPGAILTLWTWQRADEEAERVKSGALPAALGPVAERLRRQSFALLVFSGISLTFQAVLLGTGLYAYLLGAGGDGDVLIVAP